MDILIQRKRLTWLVSILALLNLLLIGFFWWKMEHAAAKPRPQRPGTDELTTLLSKELNLTQPQVKALQEIRQAFLVKEDTLSKLLRSRRDSMNQLMFGPAPADSILVRLAADVSKNEYEMELLRIEQASQLRKLLTPTQQANMEKLVREIRDYLKPEEKKNR
jgi:Spy/CpxP family protein refolding chaperone